MRKIGVVSASRSDYSIYLPVLKGIMQEADLELSLLVTGIHLLPEFGNTFKAIESDGFPISEKILMSLASDTPEGISHSIGLGIIGFSKVYARNPPDILLVLGDRFEMIAAVLAALPYKIPVAHIHGGEETVGAIDNSLRHAITKLSHLHFAATDEYAKRIIQMGEEPWRVTVSGAPALDNLKSIVLLTRPELLQKYDLPLERDFPLLVTFHPVTLEYEQTEWYIKQLLFALDKLDFPIVFTMPNADTNGSIIRGQINEFVKTHSNSIVIENLGTQGYFSLMAYAGAMVGNSSSGIIEAASFQLPVVNIGTRQQGRLRPRNVIDVGYECDTILNGIERAIHPNFRNSISGLQNPYGDGLASDRIISKLKTTPLDEKLIRKPFFDIKVDR